MARRFVTGDGGRDCRLCDRDARVGLAQLPRPPLVLEPLGASGEAIFPALEGWGPDKNGETLILLSAHRNKTQELDIPIGPDNRIEPEDPDYGQPPLLCGPAARRIKVPKGFRQQAADVDAHREWPDINGVVLAQSCLLGQLLQASRQRQRAAGDQVRAGRPRNDWTVGWHRANAVHIGWAARVVDALGIRCAHAGARRGSGACGPRTRHEPRGACLRRGRRRRRSGDRNRQRQGGRRRLGSSARYHRELARPSRPCSRVVRPEPDPARHERRRETVPRSLDDSHLQHSRRVSSARR